MAGVDVRGVGATSGGRGRRCRSARTGSCSSTRSTTRSPRTCASPPASRSTRGSATSRSRSRSAPRSPSRVRTSTARPRSRSGRATSPSRSARPTTTPRRRSPSAQFVPEVPRRGGRRRRAGDLVDRRAPARCPPHAGRRRPRAAAARRHVGPSVRRHGGVRDDGDDDGAGHRGRRRREPEAVRRRPTCSGSGRWASTAVEPDAHAALAAGRRRAARGRSRRSRRCRTARSRSACGDHRRTPTLAEGPDRRGRRGARRRCELTAARRRTPAAVRPSTTTASTRRGPRRPLPFLRNSGADADRASSTRRGRSATLVADAAAGADVTVLADAWRRRRRCLADRAGVVEERAPDGGAAARLARRPPGPDSTTPSCPRSADPVVAAGGRHHGARTRSRWRCSARARRSRACGNGGATTVSDRPTRRGSAPPYDGRAAQRPGGGATRRRRGGAQVAPRRSVTPTGHSRGDPGRTRRGRQRRRGAAGAGRDRLDGMTAALGGPSTAAGSRRVELRAGEVVGARAAQRRGATSTRPGDRPEPRREGLPDPRRDAARTAARCVADEVTVDGAAARRCPRVRSGSSSRRSATASPSPSLAGWHAGMTLPYIGWGTALGVDATVQVEGSPLARRDDRYRAGWVEAAELVDGTATVTTRFTRPRDRRRRRRDRRSVRRRRAPARPRTRRRAPGAGARRRPLPPTVWRRQPHDVRLPRGARPPAAGGGPAAPIDGHHRQRDRLAPGRRARRGTGDPADVVGATWPARGFDSRARRRRPTGRGPGARCAGIRCRRRPRARRS